MNDGKGALKIKKDYNQKANEYDALEKDGKILSKILTCET